MSMGSENGGNGNGDEDMGLDVNVEPAMSLAIESKDDLQITVTKTGLDVFNKLASVRRRLERPCVRAHDALCQHVQTDAKLN